MMGKLSRKSIVLGIVGNVACLLVALPLAAETVTLGSQYADDAFVRAAKPDENYGAAGALAIAAAGNPNGEVQSVIRFDTATAKSHFDVVFGTGMWSVASVTLRLNGSNTQNNNRFDPQADGRFSIEWLQNDNWDEGTGSPNSPASTGITYTSLLGLLSPNDQPLGSFDFVFSATNIVSDYSLDLAFGLVQDITSGSPASLRLFAADNAISYLVRSSSYSTPSLQPSLSISAVPEPSSFMLLLTGLGVAACWGIAHRRRW